MAANSVAAMGHQGQLGVKEETTYGTAVTVDRELVFVSESIQKRGTIIERDGIRGTRSRNADDTRTGPYTVSGQIVLEPTPEDWAVLLPWILGADASGTTFALAETLQSFTVVVDRVTKVFTYAGCIVSRAAISGQIGALMRLTMDVIAQSEAVGAAGTFPALTPGVTKPFQLSGDLTLTLQSSSRKCNGFELVIDNGCQPDRFMNALTIEDVPTVDRVITLSCGIPYTSINSDLYGQALAGAAGTLACAFGNYSFSAAFATLQVADNSPTIAGRGEIMLPLEMVSRYTGSTSELIITLDSTP